MSVNPQVSAAAASDSYSNRSQSEVDNPTPVLLIGQRYAIFGYKDDPVSGFHGTAYRNLDTNEIIIAYRGTDPDFKHHTGTTVKDAIVDYTMVRDQINPQEKAAHDFTAEMLKKAQDNGISKEQVTVAGHSLGGTLAEIEAWKFGLHGMTLNAYGAVDLGYGVTNGGSQITDYVVAGDVVSAASHHFGKVVTLATDQDIEKLREARYIDALSGAAEPNPLMGIVLTDHGSTKFNGPDSLLKPKNLARAQQNYADNKVAIDQFRGDIHSERAEIAEALRSTDHFSLTATFTHLSPRIQQQILEANAATVDPMVRNAVEHNPLIEGTKYGLDQTGAVFRAGGLQAQRGADQIAQGLHSAGESVQRQTDELFRGAQAFAPLNPLLVGSAALGTKAAGYIAHAEAEAYSRASHLAGQAAAATGQFLSDGTHTVKHGIGKGVHAYADAIQSRVHQGEVKIAHGIDHVSAAYNRAEKTGDTAEHVYSSAKQTVSRGMDATERKASEAYGMLTHPGQWFHSDAPSGSKQTPSPTASLHSSVHAADPAVSGHSHNDPRHRDNPHHELYLQLKARVPDASENRLLQFTDACNTKGISDRNLGEIAFDRQGGHMIFRSSSVGPMATVDVKEPSPHSAQSLQHIQQIDQTQAQIHNHTQARQIPGNQQQSQAPMPSQGF